MTTEEGNTIIAELKQWGYSVLSDGSVIGKLGQFLKTSVASSGYVQLNAYNHSKQHTFLIHRLVAAAFIPNVNNLPEVNHKDGNKRNNNFSNLEWSTRPDNIQHGFDTGLIKKSMIGRTGSKHWRSIPIIMYAINGDAVEFENASDAASKTGWNKKTIQQACTGSLKTYKGLKWRYKK